MKTIKQEVEHPSKPRSKRSFHHSTNEEGLTAFQRLTIAKAEAQEYENRRNREHWQTREQAEAAAQETAEIIQGDLYGTLPLSLATKLSGKVFTPQEVRVIIRDEIDLMVKQWVKGDRVSELAIQEAGK